MRMFGGFGTSFLKEYHDLCPKTEPVDEYEDRVKLYELVSDLAPRFSIFIHCQEHTTSHIASMASLGSKAPETNPTTPLLSVKSNC